MEDQELTAAGNTSARPAEPGVAVEDRRRLDFALTAARLNAAPDSAHSERRGIPGLREELFPAATWRRELEALHDRDQDRAARLRAAEEARVSIGLAELRAEEILQRARSQARRLVSTASAVAKARQEEADRVAAATLAEAEAGAAARAAETSTPAAATVEPGVDLQGLYARLLKMQSALRDAEARLEAFAETTRADLVARGGVVDLDALSDEGDDAVYAVPVPRRRPKSRFEVPGLTPERIEALRNEFSRGD